MKKPNLTDYIFLTILALIWASAFFNIKIATYSYEPFTLALVRVFFASIPLLILCKFKKIKIGWLSDINGSYKFENEILEICEKKLSELNKHNVKIDFLKPSINTHDLWNSWLTFRSKSIFMDIGSMDIKDIDEMTYQAIWEYKRGKNIRENDINIAIEKRKRCMDDIEQIFKDYDFLALPSAQVFPFKKELNYPEKINDLRCIKLNH